MSGGRYAYGAYSTSTASHRAGHERTRGCAEILHKIQQLTTEKVLFGPVIEPAFSTGWAPPRVHGLGLVANHEYSRRTRTCAEEK